MFAPDQYELLDFGGGRKLERFAGHVIDRPAPAAADSSPRHASLWRSADARFQLDANDDRPPQRGRWQWPAGGDLSGQLHLVRHGSLLLELAWSPFGHLGLFPEQAANWDWLAGKVAEHPGRMPLRLLNLFAYTGGSTLAAAAAGAEVTHVDASRSSVGRARGNAQHSGLADAPIRWIVEDAQKFATRELRRGRRYDALVLDPPSYGHGPKGETWLIEQHLAPLLEVCCQLLSDSPRAFLLMSCHTPAWPAERLLAALEGPLAASGLPPEAIDHTAGEMFLATADGRRLDSGVYVRSVRCR